MVDRLPLAFRLAVVAACCAVIWSADRLRTTDDTFLGAGPGPVGVAADPDGQSVYVAQFNTREVWQLDATTGSVRARVPIPDLEPKYGLVPIALEWSAVLGGPVLGCHRWGSQFQLDFSASPPAVHYFEPEVGVEPPDAESEDFDRASLVAFADGLDGTVILVMAQVRTMIESVTLVRARRDPYWSIEAVSAPIPVEHGYQRGAWPLVVSTARRALYLAEPGTGRLFEIGDDLVPRREMVVGRYPFAIALDDASGHLHVADKKLGTVSTVALASFTLERRVPACAGATSLALDSVRSALWVACQHDAAVVRLDLPALTESRRVTGIAEPAALALSPDRTRLWVAELGRGALVAVSTADDRAAPTRRPLAGGKP